MWIEASVDSLALLADGVRLLGGGYQGCHVWSLETGDRLATLWNYGGFELAPHERAVVHVTGLDLEVHRLDGSRRALVRGRLFGFSRDGTRMLFEPLHHDLIAGVVDLDGNDIGQIRTDWRRRVVGVSEAELLTEPLIARFAELRDGWYALQTPDAVRLQRLGTTSSAREVPHARLACTTDDGHFFVACGDGVTVVETATGIAEHIDVVATNDLVRVDGAGRLLIPHHDGSLHLLVVDHAKATSRRELVVGDWPLEQLIAGNGVIAIVRGLRDLAFLDVEGGRVVERVELEEESTLAIDHEQATIAIVSPTGRFELWSIEPPMLLERDQLPPGSRAIAIGPRHVAIAYDQLVHVRVRP